VPHLTHRTHIYEFPNPWVMSYWGVRGSKPPDPATVDFLVVDRTLNPRYQPLFDRLVGAGGQFRIIYQADNIVVASRVRPG
jgi:hypothetical protein